jgi:hypothetical protein
MIYEFVRREHHAGMLVGGVTNSKKNKIGGVIASGQATPASC